MYSKSLLTLLLVVAHSSCRRLVSEDSYELIDTAQEEEALRQQETPTILNFPDDEDTDSNVPQPPHNMTTTTPAPVRDPLADDVLHFQRDHNLTSAREMAKLNIMDRILIALGPAFGERLPEAPTNDTLATVPTPINITAEPCPYKYKRCSSQTFFPSCYMPRNTDAQIWPQKFNLFFNLTNDFDPKLDVINATLRLFKNDSLPFKLPKILLIKAYVYIRSLTRKRPRMMLVADAQVSSDFVGWVTLSVDKMVRRWRKPRNNHGLLITVTDIDEIPWDAPKLFVTMDCSSGLVPLPFEVQTDEVGQRYPALNVRQGSLNKEFPEEDRVTVRPTANGLSVEAVTEMQSDDPTVYDGFINTLHQVHPIHAITPTENSYDLGNSDSIETGDVTVGSDQMAIPSQYSENHPLAHLREGHSIGYPLTTYPVINRYPLNTGHVFGSHQMPSRHHGYSIGHLRDHPHYENHDVVTEEPTYENVEMDIRQRLHTTESLPMLEPSHLSDNLGERGSSAELTSGGYRNEPTPPTEEVRNQRQRGNAKERRHRKKNHQHHRRGEDRRNT